MNFASWVAVSLCGYAIVVMFAMAICRHWAEQDRLNEQCRRRANCSAEPKQPTLRQGRA